MSLENICYLSHLMLFPIWTYQDLKMTPSFFPPSNNVRLMIHNPDLHSPHGETRRHYEMITKIKWKQNVLFNQLDILKTMKHLLWHGRSIVALLLAEPASKATSMWLRHYCTVNLEDEIQFVILQKNAGSVKVLVKRQFLASLVV